MAPFLDIPLESNSDTLPPAHNSPWKSQGTGDMLATKFCVSQNGFLPSETPLKKLSDPYYTPWELLIHTLPTLLETSALRKTVDLLLTPLSTKLLKDDTEWRRAYVILTFLAHGYIWGGHEPSKELPPSITVPLLQVSNHFGLPPCATYASLCLWNFESSTGDFGDLGSLRALHTFTGTESEHWFYTLSVAMEAQCAFVLPLMIEAIEATHKSDYATMIKGLTAMIACIKKLDALLSRMYEKCRPEIFYQHIRPFLAGSKNMEHAGLPNGVFYNEGNGNGQWRKLMGGSNGQSSLIQFLDISLGVDHRPNRDSGAVCPMSGSSATNGAVCPLASTLTEQDSQMSYHEEVRQFYMPKSHRSFLKHTSLIGSIKAFVEQPRLEPEYHTLRKLYEEARRALYDYRQNHIKIATRYIVIPSKKLPAGPSVNLASASAGAGGSENLTGTGGTNLMAFLKQTRDASIWDSDRV